MIVETKEFFNKWGFMDGDLADKDTRKMGILIAEYLRQEGYPVEFAEFATLHNPHRIVGISESEDELEEFLRRVPESFIMSFTHEDGWELMPFEVE